MPEIIFLITERSPISQSGRYCVWELGKNSFCKTYLEGLNEKSEEKKGLYTFEKV